MALEKVRRATAVKALHPTFPVRAQRMPVAVAAGLTFAALLVLTA